MNEKNSISVLGFQISYDEEARYRLAVEQAKQFFAVFRHTTNHTHNQST